MNWNGKRVLVTGAGGFIGSHLAERLVREGCRVTAMLHYDSRADRGNLEFVEGAILREMDVRAGDVRDPFFMMNAVKGCEVVFHLAALIGIPYSYIAPSSYVETNIQGTVNVLQACLSGGVERMVQTSTSECYGTAQYTPIDERHPLHGQSPYAATKIGADKLAESYHLSFGLPVSIVRPFNTFGPRQSARAVIPTILSQLIGRADYLKLGTLTAVRDLNFVEDTVSGFLAVASSERTIGATINIGSGIGVTVGELANLAMQITNQHIPIVCDEQRVRPSASEVFTLVCDASLARDLAAWQPQIDLKTGLQQTAQFVERHFELYRPAEYAV